MSEKFISYNEKDLEIIKEKLLNIKSSALVIPRKDPDNIGNTLRLNW
jgi:hypothetical protein